MVTGTTEDMITLMNSILITIVVLVVTYLINKRRWKPNEPPLVPYLIPWLGHALQYKKDPVGFLTKCKKKYGSAFTLYMGGRYFTMMVDPKLISPLAKEKKLIFRNLSDEFAIKAFQFKVDNPVEHHGAMHAVHLKYFQGSGLESLMRITMKYFREVLSESAYCKDDWKEVGLLKFCRSVIFQAEMKTLFLADDPYNDEEMKSLLEDFLTFDKAFPSLIQGVPGAMTKNINRILAQYGKLLFSINPNAYMKNFFDEYEEARNLPRNSRSNKLPFTELWAAISNTLGVAFWALYYVISCDEAKKALMKEIEGSLERNNQLKSDEFFINKPQLDKMVILDSIVNETFRLTSSVSSIRHTLEDCDIPIENTGKYFRLRKDDIVIAPMIFHMDPDLYEEPLTFKYDRFLNKDGTAKTKFYIDDKLVRNHFVPFGVGVSKCPGRFWASTVVKHFLILVLLQMDLQVIDPGMKVEANLGRFGFGALPPIQDPVVRLRHKTRE